MRRVGVALMLSVILAGCASGLHTEVVSAPRSAAAARLRRVAVFPFSGPSGPQMTVEVESLLAQANENGRPFYTVVDRTTMQNALNELKLHNTGLVDARSASRLGKFVGADGIYAGSVFVPPVARRSTTQQRYNCNGSSHPGRLISGCASTSVSTVHCLDKVAQFTIVPRLIAVETATVVYQPTLTGQSEGSSCSDTGGEIDDATLVSQAATQALQKLRDDVSPHVTSVELHFKTDTAALDAPTRGRFEGGMAFAQAGRLDRACSIWRGLSAENPRNMTLNFDVAMCDENEGQYADALSLLRRLDDVLEAPDADISAALRRVGAEAQAQSASEPPAAPSIGTIRGGSGRARKVSP